MRRIVMMVSRMFFQVLLYLIKIWWCGKSKKITYEQGYDYVRELVIKANRVGKVKIEIFGVENVPSKSGFIFFPNHQGLFDALVFFESSPVPFAIVIKKEVRNVIMIKQVIEAIGAICIDRTDIKQSMQVINEVADEVRNGRNFLIFPEGTRSIQGNNLLEFKGGSFKSAVKAKCPIVPCALIDSYKPFDEKTVESVAVKIVYLQPLYYEEYMNMKTVDIASEVKSRIEKAIQEHTL